MNDQDERRIGKTLDSLFTCPICGSPKVHYRLYGYRCHNPEHTARERQMFEDRINAILRGEIVEDDDE